MAELEPGSNKFESLPPLSGPVQDSFEIKMIRVVAMLQTAIKVFPDNTNMPRWTQNLHRLTGDVPHDQDLSTRYMSIDTAQS